MIKASRLNRMYGKLTAVDNVSFEISKGEIIGLLGHNGAGKTTVMKMLTGYLEPDSGSIEIAGNDLSENLLLCQSKIGYLPENSPSYPELSVLEYLEFVAELRSLSDSEEKIKKAISRVGLEEKALLKIGTLSKGYQQRVGVAQAILSEPDILILDEPTNGLDPHQIQEMRGLIKDLSKNSTVILSTHILQEVEAVCTRVLIMLRGKLVLDKKLFEMGAVTTVELECDLDNLKAELSQIKGVKKIENKAGNYLIEISSAANDVTPEIVKLASSKNAKVYSVAPRRETLDQVFKNLEAASVEVL